MSTRYVPAVVALLALALAPRVMRAAFGTSGDDGWRAEAVASRLDSVEGIPTGRQVGWVRRRFASEDFTERTYGPTRLFVVRSVEFTSLYHHPELAVAYRAGATYAGVQKWSTEGGMSLPVHVVRADGGKRGVGAYVLLYGQDRFVERPLWFHLRLAGELVLRPRQSMTLFFVYDDSAPSEIALEDAQCVRVLMDAIRTFREQPSLRSGVVPAVLPSGPEVARAEVRGAAP